ncbi:fimbrial protein [Pseudomonas schmalbachii]|uniref:Type 1 fimbrial protein n=1 Tax=Pseudomonas schmalbachii TaxID=2816993 RepID=A0ABS3TTN0_9PSED|nr:fimbrial protein [Pseudomonas schmalbachii]MBO3277024.1 type 1 fimbrial protein [Pseudomonas schmalbachii]
MKVSIKSLLALAIIAAPGFAAAANTIVFKGEVTDQTCVVAIDGSANPTVLLDSAPVSDFAAVNDTSTPTPFTVSLTGCTVDAANPQNFTTEFLANNATASGNMLNTAAGGATGVALQLLDAVGGAQVDLSAGAVEAGTIVLPAGDTSTSYRYEVQYVSEAAAVTPGAVESAVTYAVRYE